MFLADCELAAAATEAARKAVRKATKQEKAAASGAAECADDEAAAESANASAMLADIAHAPAVIASKKRAFARAQDNAAYGNYAVAVRRTATKVGRAARAAGRSS
jgi:hypothetical protein